MHLVQMTAAYWWTHGTSCLAWSEDYSSLALFYIHQMKRWTLTITLSWSQHHNHCPQYYYSYY